MKFLCRLEYDPQWLLPVTGGYSPTAKKCTWKNLFVIKFPRQRIEDVHYGDVVVAHFTKESRRYYSTPEPGGEVSHYRGSYFVDQSAPPWGEKDVVRIYKCDPLRPGVDPDSLYRLVVAHCDDCDAPESNIYLKGSISGDIKHQISCKRSTNIQYSEILYLAVVKGPLTVSKIVKTSIDDYQESYVI